MDTYTEDSHSIFISKGFTMLGQDRIDGMGGRAVLCQFPEEISERGFAAQEDRELSFAPCEDICY